MNRPAPRKSSLSGASPILPPQPEVPATPQPATPSATPATSARPVEQAKGSNRMSYYTDPDQAGRVRSAYLAGRDRYGWRSLTDFHLHTMMQRVEELEQEFNGGHPFEPSSAGTIAPGRRVD